MQVNCLHQVKGKVYFYPTGENEIMEAIYKYQSPLVFKENILKEKF